MVVYADEKFCRYLLCSKAIIYIDHSTLKHLLNKSDSKSHLIWWILLLQEFALEIEDQKGTENIVADHFSQLPISLRYGGEDDLPIDNSFLDEHF